MTRTIIAVESDLHGGNRSALLNPKTQLERFDRLNNSIPYTPELTETQKELWELRTENIAKLEELAGDDDIHYFQTGDGTQGMKHQADLVSDRMADQITIAVANTDPILQIKNLKSVLFSAGTGAHNFLMGSADLLIKDRLKARYPAMRFELCYHGLANIGGFTIDFAHHGPFPGSREWLRGNVARYYLQSAMLHQMKAGHTPPMLFLRGHYHSVVIEVVRMNGYLSTIVVLPSMCMVDDFAQQAAKSPDDVTCGMMVFEVVNGKLFDIHQFTRTYDIRTEIVL